MKAVQEDAKQRYAYYVVGSGLTGSPTPPEKRAELPIPEQSKATEGTEKKGRLQTEEEINQLLKDIAIPIKQRHKRPYYGSPETKQMLEGALRRFHVQKLSNKKEFAIKHKDIMLNHSEDRAKI